MEDERMITTIWELGGKEGRLDGGYEFGALPLSGKSKDESQKMRIGVRGLLRCLGPAFVVSVAYIDPGNFATNISGGSNYGYSLLWVILWSNLMAVFLQTLSAKLGIATGCSLAQMCCKAFSKRTNYLLFLVAVFAAMATTMAEFLGAVLGFHLLLQLPLSLSVLLAVITSLMLTWIQRYGQRVVELVIVAFIAVICGSYVLSLILAKPDWQQAATHLMLPTLPDSSAVILAAGMLGATVMPHVIFLHSDLVQERNKGLNKQEKKRHLKLEKLDVMIAMNIAFVVNAAMVVVSAAVFARRGIAVDSIEAAHQSLEPLLGSLSSGAFGVALLASGFSSTAVGTMAGESVIEGFSEKKFSPVTKRVLLLFPGVLVIFLGVEPMSALVLSQVCLSFALPAAVVPLLLLTSDGRYMGEFKNKQWVKRVGWFIAGMIVLLNFILTVIVVKGILS